MSICFGTGTDVVPEGGVKRTFRYFGRLGLEPPTVKLPTKVSPKVSTSCVSGTSAAMTISSAQGPVRKGRSATWQTPKPAICLDAFDSAVPPKVGPAGRLAGGKVRPPGGGGGGRGGTC